jgi:hypothetical protein
VHIRKKASSKNVVVKENTASANPWKVHGIPSLKNGGLDLKHVNLAERLKHAKNLKRRIANPCKASVGYCIRVKRKTFLLGG